MAVIDERNRPAEDAPMSGLRGLHERIARRVKGR